MSDDLISRRAVLDNLEKHREMWDKDLTGDLYHSSEVRAMINEVPAVACIEQIINVSYAKGFNAGVDTVKRPQDRWIPVSERLPEDMQEVLVWFEYYRYGDYNCMYQTYGLCHVLDGKWSDFINGRTGWQDARIIAWCPMPKPYKGAENE